MPEWERPISTRPETVWLKSNLSLRRSLVPQATFPSLSVEVSRVYEDGKPIHDGSQKKGPERALRYR